MNWLIFLAVLDVMISLCASNSSTSIPSHEESTETKPRNRNFMMADPINYVGLALADKIKEEGNFFYSPLGVSMSIGMAYLGARGETALQMRRALGYDLYNVSFEQVHKEIWHICEDVVPVVTDVDYRFDVANALFSQIGLNIDGSYIDSLRSQYHANAKTLDFADQAKASDTINRWVNNETSGAIDRLVTEPLPTSTSLFIANAVHFKGTWKTTFPSNLTHDSYFYVNGNDKDVYVPTMNMFRVVLPYLKDDVTGYKYIELPYKGERIVMLLALPLRFDQPANLRMTSELMSKIQYNMTDTELQVVSIPKFKLDYEKSLKDPLKTLGMTDAFESGSADFSGMRSSGGIFLSDVMHKGLIETNEEGSEAAAVTGLLFMPISARQVDNFRADHPFLFYILDKETGTILFSGRVADPR